MTQQEIEALVDAKLVSVYSLVDKVDRVMASVQALVAGLPVTVETAFKAAHGEQVLVLTVELQRLVAEANDRVTGERRDAGKPG